MASTRCCVQPALTLERTPSGWIQRASFTHPVGSAVTSSRALALTAP